MSKKLFSKVFILLLVVGLLFAVAPTKQAQAATLCVNPGGTDGCYATIQDAVAASAAGDVINVAAGTYDIGTLVIPRPLSIIGAGDTTIVNGKFQLTNAGSVAGTYLFQAMKFAVTNSSITVTDITNIIDEVKVVNVTFDTNMDTTARAIGVGANSVAYRIKKFTVLNSRFYSTLAIYLDGDLGAVEITGNEFHITSTHWIAYNAININQSLPASASVDPAGTYIIQNNQIFVPGTAFPSASAITNQAYPGSVLDGQPGGKELTASGNTITVGTGDASTDQSLFVKDLIANTNDLFPVHNLTKDTWFTTIQAALNAAVADDVIEVGPGTYSGNLTINTPLTLQGAPDWEAKIVGFITVKASYVTVQGLDISFPTYPNGIYMSNDAGAVGDTSRLTMHHINILNNKFHNIGSGGNVKVIRAYNGVDDVLIEGNQFYDITSPTTGRGAAAIDFGDSSAADPSTGIVIRNNTFRNITSVDRQTDAILFSSAAGVTAVIENNTFDIDTIKNQGGFFYYAHAISLEKTVPGIVIRGNTFQATDPANIVSRMQVINFDGSTPSSAIVFEKNKFLVDRRMVVGTLVDGAMNWWGQDTGPTSTQRGGLVSNSWIPWCTNSECTTFSQASLSLSPATIDAATCGQQFVDVMVTDVADLTGYTLVVNFDKTKVHVDSVVNGGFLHETDNSIVVESIEDDGNTTGKLIIHAYLQAKPGYSGDPDPVSGSGSLIRINFTPLLGTTTFDVDESNSLLVGWPEVNPMPFSVTGGATATLTGGVVRNMNTSTNYCSLVTAIGAVPTATNQTLQLLTDITIPETVTVDKALTLDLNGKVATASTGINALHVTTGGALTVNDTGTTGKITGGTRAVMVNGGGSLTLNNGTLDGPGFDGVFVYGEGSSVTVNGGKITGKYYGISGNGSTGGPYDGINSVTVNGGEVQGGETAIFHPQRGLLLITGGIITGGPIDSGSYNGIEMKAGDLKITGGIITTDAAFVPTPDQTGNGNTKSGDAILINNVTGYQGTMTVEITGGTFTSANGYALREIKSATADRTASVKISGGTFNGGLITVEGQNKANEAVYFDTVTPSVLQLTGGAYNTDPGDNVGVEPYYVFDPYITYLSGSMYYIAVEPVIASTDIEGYYLVDGVVDDGREFSVSLTNPTTGAVYPKAMFKITIPNATLADLNNVDFFEEGWPLPADWHDMTFTEVGTDLVGWYGGIYYGGFPLPADGIARAGKLRVDFAKAGTYTVNLELYSMTGDTLANPYDYSADTVSLLATKTFTMNVYDKPTITFQLLDKYFLTGDPQNFQVTFENPSTGGTYEHVVFQISIPAAEDDITSLKYLGTALTLDCTTATGFCTTTFDFGYAGGIPLAPSQGGPWTLELTAAKAGTYPMTFTLVDLDSDPDRPLQSAIGTAIVYNKPVITTNLAGPYNAGVPVAVTVNVDNVSAMFTPTNAFELFLNLPADTVVTYDGQTVTCGASGCELINVTLAPGANALPITVTFPGAYNAPISVELWDPDVTRTNALATYTTSANVVVNSGFTVTGNFSMQGNLSRAGVPVTFTWNGDLVSYGPTGYSTAVSGTNFSQVLTYGGSYTITTNQPRYLNVYEDGVNFFKTINLTGDRLLPELRLRGGNAYWRVVNESNDYTDQYDNTVNGSDASVVGTDWGPNSSSDLTINHGDVNFDGKVNIQDLALVGGNYGLTSAAAYGTTWLP